MIKKCLKTSESIPQALLHMRATPIDAKLPSSAVLLLKRRVATCLLSHTNENRDGGVHDRLEERRSKMTTSYNKTAGKSALPPLYPGQPICIIDKSSRRWFRGTVRKNVPSRDHTLSRKREVPCCDATGANYVKRNVDDGFSCELLK